MYKRLNIVFLFFFSFLNFLSAQNPQAEALFAKFKAAAVFDYNYPREKVYLHLDNSAYLERDTLWYKAYVVRASSLKPTDLSKVLYVEILNADGQLMEKQTLQLDENGQADGAFALDLPLRAGYYEIRAYTREMTNWDEAACFSRFFPLFAASNPQKALKPSLETRLEDLFIPEPNAHKKISLGSPRPYRMGSADSRLVSFYPEGGNRAKGVSQRVAFKITNGKGDATEDTLRIFSADGNPLTEAVPAYEGMGSFTLPADFLTGYAQISGNGLSEKTEKRRYALPVPCESYAIQTQTVPEGLVVQVSANDSVIPRKELLGLAVFNREKTCFFDTLTAEKEPIGILVPERALRPGVNRVELFDIQGHSRATRLVWASPKTGKGHRIQVNVKQNQEVYNPFSPAVLKMSLKNAKGEPVQTTLSIAVRDDDGKILESDDGGIEADLLLSSELKGYIHRPELYFTNNDAEHRHRLDLLLLVQGWTANSFDTMCGKDTFRLKQPIEEKLMLRGTLYKDNNKLIPQPYMHLDMKAYSSSGGSLSGITQTDENGKFAFESNVNYQGDFIAQFTLRNEKGKRKWGRLTIDRWFAPAPRSFWAPELALNPHKVNLTGWGRDMTNPPETFVWEDTIPHRLSTLLGEANVVVRGKYGGFTGNRYTWKGGERAGMERALKFYNIEQEVERVKDMGKEPGELTELLGLLESNVEYERYGDVGTDFLTLNNAQPEASSADGPKDTSYSPDFSDAASFQDRLLSPSMTFRGKPMTVYFNNEPFAKLLNRYPELYGLIQAETIKSVAIVADQNTKDAITGKLKRQSVTSYKMFIYDLRDDYRLREKKGIEKRRIQGFTRAMHFYTPNYRQFDLPNEGDVRRTLHWEPSLKTDSTGCAHLIFFTNARKEGRLDISIRGITSNGEFIDYDYSPSQTIR